jgi:hypothetical protein
MPDAAVTVAVSVTGWLKTAALTSAASDVLVATGAAATGFGVLLSSTETSSLRTLVEAKPSLPSPLKSAATTAEGC